MPELPEVEVVKRSLEKKILNLIIQKVKINDSKLRYNVNKEKIYKLKGKKIEKIYRRSKFLIFQLTGKTYMLVHLGMTGKFFFIDKKKKKLKTSFYYKLDSEKDSKHDRIIFYLESNQKLIYNDVRKFGFIKFYNEDELDKSKHLKNLGPEPLNIEWNSTYFKRYILGRQRTIKDILMDQKFVSGIGNIYANETLFLSSIKPSRKVNKIKDHEIEKIIKNTKKILESSIKLGGSSIKDFSNDGKKGDFQQYFSVYGRKGEICSNIDCNQLINKSKISNRATFFCKFCQK